MYVAGWVTSSNSWTVSRALVSSSRVEVRVAEDETLWSSYRGE